MVNSVETMLLSIWTPYKIWLFSAIPCVCVCVCM